MEVQRRNNDKEIFAPLKNKWLVNKPEEEVRQKYICRLVDSYGYSLDQMDQEINAGKINNYDVVVPPMDVQHEMVAHIKEQKALAKQLKQKAKEMRENALKEFENEIFDNNNCETN